MYQEPHEQLQKYQVEQFTPITDRLPSKYKQYPVTRKNWISNKIDGGLGTKLEKKQKYPKNAFVQLKLQTNDGQQGIGVGCFIAPNIVLTSLFNIHDNFNSTPSSNVLLKLHNQQWVHSQEFIYVKQEGDALTPYNYGLIKLEFDQGLNQGHFGLDINRQFEGKQLYTNQCRIQLKSKNKTKLVVGQQRILTNIQQTQKNKISYQLKQSSKSMFGNFSPIYYIQNDKYYVVGLHNRYKGNQRCEGTLLQPNSFQKLSKTQYKQAQLNCENECIELDDMDQITEFFQSKQNLTSLNLNRNKMGPQLIQELSPMCLNNKHFLKKICLSNNKLQDLGCRQLARLNLRNLKSINLALNEISDDGFRIFVEQIQCLYLQELIIDYNNIGVQGIAILNRSNWRNLKYFSAVKCGLLIQDMEEQFNVFWPTLKKLNLSQNKIGMIGFKIICDKIRESWCDLQQLYLKKSEIKPTNESKEQNKSILQSNLNNLKNTKILDLSHNQIFKGIHKLDAIQLNIQTLNLCWCSIDNQGMECLKKLILPKLKNINLSSNDFNSESLQKIFVDLWRIVQDIDYGRNQIQDEGVQILLDMKFQKLERISLQQAEITEQGILAIIQKHAKNWPNLKYINLSTNILQFEQKRRKLRKDHFLYQAMKTVKFKFSI